MINMSHLYPYFSLESTKGVVTTWRQGLIHGRQRGVIQLFDRVVDGVDCLIAFFLSGSVIPDHEHVKG